MAIGDAVVAFMGTGTVNRQPSAGVEEQITGITSEGTTDTMNLYNGSTAAEIYDSEVLTGRAAASTGAPVGGVYNLAVMINNSIYLRKDGTTDLDAVFGVQTNA